MATQAKLNIGVIGLGRIGALHAEHATHRISEARIVSIADRNEDTARQCAERNGIPQWMSDYRGMLADPDVAAVLICTPTSSHAQIIRDAAAARKHIFVEKPVAPSLHEIDEALSAVEKAGVRLQVGFQRRFDPTYRRVYDAIRRGEIGTPHLLRIVSRDPSPPSEEYLATCGGLFLDMTIHDFDVARFLIGSEVDRIYAVGAARIDLAHCPAGDVDTALITLEFENGVFASIDNSRQAVYGYDQRVEAFGSRGSIESENHYPNEVIVRTAEHIRRDLPLNFFMDRYTQAYANEVASFVRAIIRDEEPAVTGEDGRMAVAIGIAAKQSLAERRPVSLDEITGA